MKSFGEYNVIESLSDSRHRRLFRVHKEGDHADYAMHLFKEWPPNTVKLVRFKKTFERIKALKDPGIVNWIDFKTHRDWQVLIVEYIDGISLTRYLKRYPLTLELFLRIAADLSETLGRLHNQGLIHGAIRPDNILIQPSTAKVRLTNFDALSLINGEREEINTIDTIQNILPYISPEQSGRMNRQVDYRTDLYSLGITFYEMLANRPPFQSQDPLEIIHAHIARKPHPVMKINPSVPSAISEIILKLLAKAPEDRYQSETGLTFDLRQCTDYLTKYNIIPFFETGSKDFQPQLNAHLKLTGREHEKRKLETAYAHVADGQSQTVLITGVAGIGKSALVKAVHHPLTLKNGCFISGKFEPFQADIPYSAIIRALRQMVQQTIALPPSEITSWKRKLLELLGSNGKIIADVIPEIELIIGSQPDVPVLDPKESCNRFHIVFQNFISASATKERPLFFFLDNLQWADNASLKLLQTLVADKDIRYFLFIGAYRNHPPKNVERLLDKIKNLPNGEHHIDQIQLTPLTIRHIDTFLSNTLRCETDHSLPLARLIHTKTNGNPFLIRQFLQNLYQEELILLDRNGKWFWNIEKIEHKHGTDNVIDMTKAKISNLDHDTKEILMTGACIGRCFTLELLSKVLDRCIDSILNSLTIAISRGLIDTLDQSYVFHHDRIHEIAYNTIPTAKKPELHLKIGKVMLETVSPESEGSERLFQVVQHLNQGIERITLVKERTRLAKLNLTAGRHAKQAAAYLAAFNYFSTGIFLFGENGWHDNYNQMLTLYKEAAEAAYLTTHYDEMERLCEEGVRHARSLMDKITLYEIRIRTYMARNKPKDAIRIGITVLNLLGVKLPEKPHRLYNRLVLFKTRMILLRQPVDSLVDLPQMRNPHHLAVIRILSVIFTAAYYSKPTLLPLLVVKTVNLSIRYGNTRMSPFYYAAYGMILCATGNIDDGYHYGKAALSVLDKMDLKHERAKTNVTFNGFIRHWKEHANSCLLRLLDAHQDGIDVGDMEFAAHALSLYCWITFQVTDDLKTASREVNAHIETLKTMHQESQLHIAQIAQTVICNLIYPASRTTAALDGPSYTENTMLPLHISAGDRTAMCAHHIAKSILCLLFGDYVTACRHIDLAHNELASFTGLLMFAGFHFYESLVRLAVYKSETVPRQKQILKTVSSNQKRLKKWAEHAPMNFQHKYCTVEAERNRIYGKNHKAADFYRKAIGLSEKNGYLQDQAMALELAGQFFIANGENSIGRLYITEAIACYLKWGAVTKVRHMDRKYAGLLGPFRLPHHTPGLQLDYFTVLKALQALSTEIIFEKLLKRLLKIVIEMAGAERALFISVQNEQLFVEAESHVNGHGNPEADGSTVKKIPLEQYGNTIVSAIHHVNRTRDYLVLDNAQSHDDFTNDSYVRQYGVKSVLCLPVIRQTFLSGILYLENNKTAYAFRNDRIDTLRLISSQAAISVENALLYQNLWETGNALRESEKKYRLLADNVSDMIWILDLNNMRFIYLTPSVRSLFGFTQEEARQMTLKEMMTPDSFNTVMKVLTEELSIEATNSGSLDRTRTLELESFAKDGRIVWTESTMRFLRNESNQAISILGVTRNIQSRKQAEAKIHQLNQELEQRVEQRTAELQESLAVLKNAQHQLVQAEKMAALGSLVAGVAHEINTPLGVSVTAVTFLEDRTEAFTKAYADKTTGPAELEKYVTIAREASKIIYTNLNRAAELINSFKNVAVNQTYEIKRTFLLKPYIEDIINSLRPKFKRTRHIVMLTCPEALSITSYPGVFSQIVTNLIMNSLIHGFENITAGEMRIEISSDDTHLIMRYADNGRGMDTQTVAKIFDPFFTTKRNKGGTGLGMHILYNLVTQTLNGEIKVESVLDEGTEFDIRVPFYETT